jgi:hypothetical protein
MVAEWGIHRAFMMRKLARQGVTIKGRPEAACHCDAGSGPGLFADSGSAKRDRRLVAAAIGQIADAGEAQIITAQVEGSGTAEILAVTNCVLSPLHCRNGFSDVRRCARNRARYLLDRVCMRHRSNPGKPSRKGAAGKAA